MRGEHARQHLVHRLRRVYAVGREGGRLLEALLPRELGVCRGKVVERLAEREQVDRAVKERLGRCAKGGVRPRRLGGVDAVEPPIVVGRKANERISA